MKTISLQLPEQYDTPQHFPRFILVESKEENRQITSLSPFLIQKVIQSIAGEPESIKKLHRSNQLHIEISKKAHAENLRAQTFHDLKVRVYPHTSLNSSKGVICCPELRNCGEEEILEGTRSQGVIGVKRLKKKKKRKWRVKRHKHLCFYFQYASFTQNGQSGIL